MHEKRPAKLESLGRSCFGSKAVVVESLLLWCRGAAESVVGGGGGGVYLRENSVDGVVELVDVCDLDPIFLGDDKDGGGLGEADSFAEGVVGLDFCGEESIGIYDEGHGFSVGLEELLGEVLEVVLAGDGLLAGEDGAAVVFGEFGIDLVLDVAGCDGRVAAPDVHIEGEVVTDEGNLVVFDGGMDDGEGMGAGGALEVFELVDGDFGAGGRLDHGGVAEGVGGIGWGGELRVCGREGEGEGKAGQGETIHCNETHRVVIGILSEGVLVDRGRADFWIDFATGRESWHSK